MTKNYLNSVLNDCLSNGEIITYKILGGLFYRQFYLLLKRIATLFNEKVAGLDVSIEMVVKESHKNYKLLFYRY
jgi:hypothetical protein